MKRSDATARWHQRIACALSNAWSPRTCTNCQPSNARLATSKSRKTITKAPCHSGQCPPSIAFMDCAKLKRDCKGTDKREGQERHQATGDKSSGIVSGEFRHYSSPSCQAKRRRTAQSSNQDGYCPAVASTLVNSATSANSRRCRSVSPFVASASSISSGLTTKLTRSDPFDGNTSSSVTSAMLVVPYLNTPLYARRSNEAFERMRMFASMFSDALGGEQRPGTCEAYRGVPLSLIHI